MQENIANTRTRDVLFHSDENQARDVVLGFICDAAGKHIGLRVWDRKNEMIHTALLEKEAHYWNLNIYENKMIPKCCNISEFPVLTLPKCAEVSPLQAGIKLVSSVAGAWVLGEHPDGRLRLISVDGLVKNVTKATAIGYHTKYGIANAYVNDDGELGAKVTGEFPTIKPYDTTVEPSKEAKGTFSIYQLKDDDDNRKRRFIGKDQLARQGERPESKNYKKVYERELAKDTTLVRIFEEFNVNHPVDFKGHSLSVSDVVVITRRGVSNAFYVDYMGYRQCQDFFVDEPKQQVAGPYVLATYTNWSGGQYWDRMETVTERFDFCCTLLDVSTLTETRYTRAELETFLKKNPTITIPNIRHENGVLKNIYALNHPHCYIEGEYALVTAAKTNRGKFAICQIYKKGVGLVKKFETQHYTHYDWTFELLVAGKDIKIKALIEKYGRGTDAEYEYLLQDTGANELVMLKAPTQSEVDRGN